jgi:two-component system phosphate regulon sensor histidine kinase PhoR
MNGTTAPHEDLLAEALEALPDPVILVDRRASVVFANGPSRAAFPSLRQGSPLAFALRMPEAVDAVERALRGEAVVDIEFTARGAVERTFALRACPLGTARPADRSGPAAIVTLRDRTAAIKLEAMRVDFIANASHELRTPLASLLGFIETLQGPAKGDAAAQERFLAIMLAQAERMKRLVDDLLSLSRAELNAHRRPTDRVDIGTVVAQIVDSSTRPAEKRGVALRFDKAGEPLVCAGDRDELLRVVENLVENAVRYGGSGGAVDLTVRRIRSAERDEIEFAIKDYGPGIEAEHLPRLTERFYRVDGAVGREKGGTGLGLAIVKHIVNRHGGRLAVESRPGEGACFRVVIPALTT